MFEYANASVENGVGSININPSSTEVLHAVKISYKKKEILKIEFVPNEQIEFVIDGFQFNISSLLISEKYRIETAIKITKKPTEAYELLNISRRTFYRKVREYGLQTHKNLKP